MGGSPKSVVLLGAGASIDAGVPGAYDLTPRIYDALVRRSHGLEASLLGFVHSKLVTRNVKLGRSPFEALNVEEVYDALKRFLERDTDPLSEFVSSWDEGMAGERFSEEEFETALQNAVRHSVGSAINGNRVLVERDLFKKVSKPVSQAFSKYQNGTIGTNPLAPYLDALATCLQPQDQSPEYLRSLVEFAVENCDVIGSLNYDLLIEQCARTLDHSISYGLTSWNDRKIVRYDPANLRLAKLHGSLNWVEIDDDIEVETEPGRFTRRALIFGGGHNKLVPHGPYLQLRSTFEKRLRATTLFGIIGYSFQDAHMNAMIRLWVATKRRAKLVILNPSLPHDALNKIGRWFDVDKGRIAKHRIEIVHIKKGAAQGMQQFIEELSANPVLPSPDRKLMGIRVEQ